MDSQPLSTSNYGRAANVGSVTVDNQHNNFDGRSKKVSVKKLRRNVDQSKTIIYNYGASSGGANHSAPPVNFRWPEAWRDEARFALRASWFPNNYRWSVPLADITSPDEDARLRAELQAQWQQTEERVRELNEAVAAFQSCRRSRGWRRSGSDSQDSDTNSNLAVVVTEGAVRGELEASIDFYNRGIKKQSPVLGSLRTISMNLHVLSSWLAALGHRGSSHRSSILFALKSVIEATRGKDRPDDEVVETVAAMVNTFATDGLEDYLAAMRSDRLTKAMETDTIETFEKMVAILVPLLERDSGWKRRRSPRRETVDDGIKQLEESLRSVRNAVFAARNRLTQQRLYRDMSFEVPRPDERGLYVTRHIHHFLREDYPEAAAAHAWPGWPPDTAARPTRRASIAGNKADPIPTPTLLTYLGYSPTQITREIDYCLRQARPSGRDVELLTSFTRRPAYRAWLAESSRHSALLVRGSATSALLHHRRRAFSPLSFLCARLAHEHAAAAAGANDDRVAVLTYFCDLHAPGADVNPAITDPSDPTPPVPSGPAHLLARLIGQLLAHPAVARVCERGGGGGGGPVLFDRRAWARGIRAGSVGTLVRVFAALVRALRPLRLVVFCLVDAVARLEKAGGDGGGGGSSGGGGGAYERVLAELTDLAQERKRRRRRGKDDRMVFKLLVTAGDLHVDVEKFFDEGEVLVVQR